MSPSPPAPAPSPPLLDLPEPVPLYAPVLSQHYENAIEEVKVDRVTGEEVQLDEDGEETEYAEFTLEELQEQERLLRAQLGSIVKEEDAASDQKAAEDE